MRVRFERADAYPGMAFAVTTHESARFKNAKARVLLEASGDLAARDLFRADFEDWLKTKRLRPQVRRRGDCDMHEVYLRGWPQVAEFLAVWIGGDIFTLVIEDASTRAVRHSMEQASYRDQVKAVEVRLELLESRFRTAALAFLDPPSHPPQSARP